MCANVKEGRGYINIGYHNVFRERVLLIKYSGKINFSDIVKTWENILQEQIVKPHTKGVINDYRKTDIVLSEDELDELIVYFTNNNTIFKGLRLALLLGKPEQFVYGYLAAYKRTDFYFFPFSTEPAAIDWVLKGDR